MYVFDLYKGKVAWCGEDALESNPNVGSTLYICIAFTEINYDRRHKICKCL